jgi:hypothetical protein
VAGPETFVGMRGPTLRAAPIEPMSGPKAAPRVTRRSEVLVSAPSPTPSPAPPSVAQPVVPAEPPSWACKICRPPIEGRMWKRADSGYATCGGCHDRLGQLLDEISRRYQMLSPAPARGVGYGTRGAPGFGSRSPASEHVIVMMDARSATGDNARTWLGGDGRLHRESERPPLSIFSVLDTICWDVAEARGYDGGHKQVSVSGLCTWLDGQLDWLTRQADIAEVHASIRALAVQLRPVTGDPRVKVGQCPNTIDDGESTHECLAPLFAPANNAPDDSIRCPGCARRWTRPEWMDLGRLLSAPPAA